MYSVWRQEELDTAEALREKRAIKVDACSLAHNCSKNDLARRSIERVKSNLIKCDDKTRRRDTSSLNFKSPVALVPRTSFKGGGMKNPTTSLDVEQEFAEIFEKSLFNIPSKLESEPFENPRYDSFRTRYKNKERFGEFVCTSKEDFSRKVHPQSPNLPLNHFKQEKTKFIGSQDFSLKTSHDVLIPGTNLLGHFREPFTDHAVNLFRLRKKENELSSNFRSMFPEDFREPTKANPVSSKLYCASTMDPRMA